VGVGIANPQRALEVAGDLVTGGTVSAGNPLMYRNRIINGDMRIAQRGTSNVVPTGVGAVAYMIDRFTTYTSFTGGNVTQYQGALVASDTPYQLGLRYYANLTCLSTVTGFSFFNYIQSTELITISDWNWGTSFGAPVTLSFWFRSNAPTGSLFTMCLNVYGTSVNYLAPYTVNSSGAWQYVTMTIPPPPNGTSLGYQGGGVGPYITAVNASTTGTLGWSSGSQCISGTYNWTTQAGNYVHFTGLQLEKGTVATPFEVRPYATELALCQRYYHSSYYNAGQSIGQANAFNNALQYSIPWSNSQVFNSFQVFLPVTPRGSGTVTFYSPNSGSVNNIAIVWYNGSTLTVNDYGLSALTVYGSPAFTVSYNSTYPTTTGMLFRFHYTMSAEL